MKNIILFFTLAFMLFSCDFPTTHKGSTSNLRLRQLANMSETETSGYTTGIFFTSYHSHQEDVDYIKVFAKVGDTYRFLEFPASRARIKLDSTAKTPYIIINYEYESREPKKYSNTYVCDHINGYKLDNETYTIVCHEKYLPEKLLPIDISK
jgi:hypothetical protein